MKKLFSIVMAMIMVLSLGVSANVQAADEPVCIDGSYLLDTDSSEVTVGSMTRGVYLKSGSSTINEQSTGVIGAGGDTTANKVVDNIEVFVRVERLVNGKWYRYTSWSASKQNAYYVSTSKKISVPTGYYYRVWCTHYANSDVAHSYTDGIYI